MFESLRTYCGFLKFRKEHISAFVQSYFSLYPIIFGQKDLNAFLLFASDVIFERRSEIRIAILSV